MAPTTKKIIAVIGATGNQGGSVARTFLALPEWHVRCLTRNPSSKPAQDLLSLGAEVVRADMDSEHSLSNAFKNVHAIFLNTDFWETYLSLMTAQAGHTNGSEPCPSTVAVEREISHGKKAALAASKVPTLERFIYSSLVPMNKLYHGKFNHSYHWESKAAIMDFIQNEVPELAKKTSVIYLGAYNTNPLFMPRLDPASGKYTLSIALSTKPRIPFIDPIASTGPFVRALVETEPVGTRLLAYDSYLTMNEILDIWSRASGKEASLRVMTLEQMHDILKIPMEVLEALGFIEEFGYTGGLPLVEPDKLTEKVVTKSFEKWMMGKDWKEVLEASEQMMINSTNEKSSKHRQ